MSGLSNLNLFHVLALRPAVDAGVILRSAFSSFADGDPGKPLNLHRSGRTYVVYTPGSGNPRSFREFTDAWCWFVGRREQCSSCNGSGYTGDYEAGHPPIACSVCGGFGKITEQQLIDLRLPPESLFPGDK